MYTYSLYKVNANFSIFSALFIKFVVLGRKLHFMRNYVNLSEIDDKDGNKTVRFLHIASPPAKNVTASASSYVLCTMYPL